MNKFNTFIWKMGGGGEGGGKEGVNSENYF